MQRTPYIEMTIEDISKTDTRVRIVGVCVYVDLNEQYIVIDDKTGHIKVNLREGVENLEDLMGKTIRVLGTVITYPDTGKLEIGADILQNFPVDFENYLTFRQIERLIFKGSDI
ncbi:MAG: hypothetical protein ACE5R6_06095 [Candidatus Heimdallarchaeota archaeon]